MSKSRSERFHHLRFELRDKTAVIDLSLIERPQDRYSLFLSPHIPILFNSQYYGDMVKTIISPPKFIYLLRSLFHYSNIYFLLRERTICCEIYMRIWGYPFHRFAQYYNCLYGKKEYDSQFVSGDILFYLWEGNK